MKYLEKEFVMNADKCGDHTFRQIKRTGNVALYERIKIDTGLSFGYEIFFVKTVKAGAPLPGGNVVQEDYEQYPGKSAFGRTAWFLGSGKGSLEWCLKRLDELVKEYQPVEENEEDVTVAVVNVQKTEKTELKFPQGKFTHSDLADFNKKTRQQVYNFLQQSLKQGTIKPAGEKTPESGKGKAAKLFEIS